MDNIFAYTYRVPNQPDPNTVPTSFTLPRQLLALVQKKAKARMTNKSDIIRQALMASLTPKERQWVEEQITATQQGVNLQAALARVGIIALLDEATKPRSDKEARERLKKARANLPPEVKKRERDFNKALREQKKAAKEKRTHLRDVDTVSLAVFSEMGAGAPLMPTSKPIGEVRVRRGRFPEDTFAVKVAGSSMTQIDVRDGDLVAMRWVEHQEAEPGNIVCVHIFGDGSVLKQLVERDGHRWLVSRNPAYPDICLDCDGEPKGRIQAVMIGKI